MADVLSFHGVRSDDAELVADSLVRADIWGHQSHGTLRLPWYVDRLKAGTIVASAVAETVVDKGPIAVFDGHDGIGQVLAARMAEESIARAKAHGVGVVAMRNSNHFGTASYFTRMAAEAGCVGILTTNSSPAMAPWGGRTKSIGSNPWSIAVPTATGVSVMDISNTVVARGKIYLARQRGEEIPHDWAITAEGKRTTDAAEALAGTILPIAGHKGYVISFMMDVLSGVLTGSGFGSQVAGPYQASQRSRSGHLFLALEISQFLPESDFATRMGELISEATSVEPAEGFDGVLYPGELEEHNEELVARFGLHLPRRTVDDVAHLATEAGVESSHMVETW